ncbi:ras association domain-containing protein 8-like [Carassius auratus]|uniref:Ras association domain-containing protein 8-like n=1 Tax=Carassius auratus TaxID=7957 RepID=A0A6P6JGU9_CARAU|nr:ras association domain-containing protein 8-like [Carassius auratus]XP_026058881.1 ras association domain-containing protein 8-like [Carassius auratus]XP_026058883.1 ras association domain-containing protein 8-like [Carassius auratus]
MELKVWVDGVVRVVCGLSEETSCQDVVIALAQAIGQTGRYVLIQKLRDSERQLLANERPLESLAKLGQHSSEVQFFLRRTGPSSSEEQSLHNRTLPHSKPSTSELKRGLPKKSFTFNLGPSSSPHVKTKDSRITPSPEQRTSPDAHTQYLPGPSKEEVLQHVLQQRERLRALESHLLAVDKECKTWEESSAEESSLQAEMEVLEKTLWRNQQELVDEESWEEELRIETERERGMKRWIGELHAKLDDCGQKLHEFNTRAMQLEEDIQREMLQVDLPDQSDSKDSLGAVEADLQSRQKQGEELKAELLELEKALGRAETLLKAKQEEVEELNKELRQCNLQQFIKQAGALPTPTQPHTDLSEHPEQLDLTQQQHDTHKDSDSPPCPSVKQLVGHPRSLQRPLVSGLNPEVLTSRESSWR